MKLAVTLQNNSKTLLNTQRSLYLEIASKKCITLCTKPVFVNLRAAILILCGCIVKTLKLLQTFLLPYPVVTSNFVSKEKRLTSTALHKRSDIGC